MKNRKRGAYALAVVLLAMILAAASRTATAQASQTFPCRDLGMETDADIWIGGAGPDVFCRLIALNREYLTGPAEIGDLALIRAGVLHAVDVFGLKSDGTSFTALHTRVTFCARGSQAVFFRSALDREAQPLSTWFVPATGFTCARVPATGMIVITSDAVYAEATPESTAMREATPETAVNCAVTTTHPLNFRTAPNINTSSVIAVVPRGMSFVPIGHVAGWFQVSYRGGEGWLSAAYLTASAGCP